MPLTLALTQASECGEGGCGEFGRRRCNTPQQSKTTCAWALVRAGVRLRAAQGLWHQGAHGRHLQTWPVQGAPLELQPRQVRQLPPHALSRTRLNELSVSQPHQPARRRSPEGSQSARLTPSGTMTKHEPGHILHESYSYDPLNCNAEAEELAAALIGSYECGSCRM